MFVLNGFIYSLFGLYDLAQLGEGEMKVTAQKLYDEGMKSLKVMLPLFDSGKDNTADEQQRTKMQTIRNHTPKRFQSLGGFSGIIWMQT